MRKASFIELAGLASAAFQVALMKSGAGPSFVGAIAWWLITYGLLAWGVWSVTDIGKLRPTRLSRAIACAALFLAMAVFLRQPMHALYAADNSSPAPAPRAIPTAAVSKGGEDTTSIAPSPTQALKPSHDSSVPRSENQASRDAPTRPTANKAKPHRITRPVSANEAPAVAALRIVAQRRIVSTVEGAPYGLEVAIQTSVTLDSVTINVLCSGPVASASIIPGADYTGIASSNAGVAPGHDNIVIAYMKSPPFIPDRPLIVRMYSRAPIDVVELRWDR